MFPLRAIIAACVALRIHPNILTLVGAIINVGAAWALGYGRFILAGLVMIVANIFDFIDGKVAHQLKLESRFGAFWDSTLDRFSDLALLVGLIYLYSKLGRSDYVLVAALTLIFSIMTSYARARAESLVEKCKVGFMERPERIVLFMIGAFTNRMAAVLWVVLVLSILAVANRIYYTYLMLNGLPAPSRQGLRGVFNRAFFWTDERATLPYDLWVHRDPRLRMVDASRLARRPDGVGARVHPVSGELTLTNGVCATAGCTADRPPLAEAGRPLSWVCCRSSWQLLCVHAAPEVPMLHKTSYMRGFHIVATDGEIGHVDDFLVDESWNVRYLVVDTSNWIGGKSVLISPSKLEKVDSPDKQIRVRMSRSEIERSPSVDSASIELIETLPPVFIM